MCAEDTVWVLSDSPRNKYSGIYGASAHTVAGNCQVAVRIHEMVSNVWLESTTIFRGMDWKAANMANILGVSTAIITFYQTLTSDVKIFLACSHEMGNKLKFAISH